MLLTPECSRGSYWEDGRACTAGHHADLDPRG